MKTFQQNLVYMWKGIMLYSLLTLLVHDLSGIFGNVTTLREKSSQTNVILQYKLLAPILSTVCSVIQQS